MPKKICDMDCFNCIYDDCKYDGSQIAKEGLMLRNAGCPTDKELKAKEPKGKTKTKPYTEKQKEYKRQYAIKNKERIKEYKKTKRSTTKNTKTNLCVGRNKSMKEEKPLRDGNPSERQTQKRTYSIAQLFAELKEEL